MRGVLGLVCARAVLDVRVCAREKDSTHRLRWYFGGRLGVGICWLSSRTMVRGRLGVGLEAVEKEGPVWQSRAGSLIPSRGRRRIFGVVALYPSCRLFSFAKRQRACANGARTIEPQVTRRVLDVVLDHRALCVDCMLWCEGDLHVLD